METTEHQLLQAVIDDPFEDGPRLTYAAWLHEHGDAARAELIRLQCEMERDQTRINQLLAENGKRWAEPYDQRSVFVQSFRRGFPEDLSVGFPVERLFEAQEFIEANTPVTGLKIHSVDDAEVALIVNNPITRHLKKLHVMGGDFGPAGIRAICRSANMKHLTDLAIGSQNIGHSGITSVIQAPFCRQLERLTFLGDESLQAGGHFPRVIEALNHDRIRELNWLEQIYRGGTSMFSKAKHQDGRWPG